ncbi:MAG TPA: penicillin-binding protein 2 [Clostridiales bacterium]|nr:penicillin-binding protein 2 [Clostridiales bacterium]HPP68554.1 penicillin-binding protein 2 [Clostridiales bacterium]
MAKRLVVLFAIFSLMLCSLCMRILQINIGPFSASVSAQSNKRTISIAESRGAIYDRNGELLVNTKKQIYAAVIPSANVMSQIDNLLTSVDKSLIRKNLERGLPAVYPVGGISGNTPEIKYITTFKRYEENQPAAHLIGYISPEEKKGVSGLEKSFDQLLSSHSGRISVSFGVDGTGKALIGEGITINDENYNSPAGLMLTLDKRLQGIVENALDIYDIEMGAAVVLKAETSEILALASRPVFDPSNPSVSLKAENAPFLNRALMAYSVGSIFKPVVAAAAIENGISESFEHDCVGYVQIGSNRFRCHNRSGHGVLDMAGAIANSCNTYFIELSKQVGAEKVYAMANAFGFGREIELSDGLLSAAGSMPDEAELLSPAALANFSFGQGKLLATPLQIAAMYAAIANGGYYREPYVLMSMLDDNGQEYAYYMPPAPDRIIKASTAKKLISLLKETVDNGNGAAAKPDFATAAGKTATAQTGQYENGKELLVTWFAGFFPAEEPEYVIVIMKERGSASTKDCTPVFKYIADMIIKNKL